MSARAAPSHFPYQEHRTMAEVMKLEAWSAKCNEAKKNKRSIKLSTGCSVDVPVALVYESADRSETPISTPALNINASELRPCL